MKRIDPDKVKHPHVRPRKLRDGHWVLDEIITLHETVLGMLYLNKTVRRLWPPFKQSNGRGRRFDTADAALCAYSDHNASVAAQRAKGGDGSPCI